MTNRILILLVLIAACGDDELPMCSELGCPPKTTDYCRAGSECVCQPTPDAKPRLCIYDTPELPACADVGCPQPTDLGLCRSREICLCPQPDGTQTECRVPVSPLR